MIRLETIAEPSASDERPSRPEWRSAVLASDLAPWVKVAAFGICEFVNDGTGSAYPAYETIAGRCGLKVRGVRAAVKQLVMAGYLIVKRAGFSKPNRFVIRLPAAIRAQSCPSEEDAPIGSQSCPNEEPIGSQTCPSYGHDSAARSVTPVPANLNPNLDSNPDVVPSTPRVTSTAREASRGSEKPQDRSRRLIAEVAARLTAERTASSQHPLAQAFDRLAEHAAEMEGERPDEDAA